MGLYDSGSNISLLNFDFWKKTNIKKNRGGECIRGVTGITKSMGTATLNLKIGNIEKLFTFFIIKSDNFKEDVLLGLDAIQNFRLCQDENLKIAQKCNVNKPILVNMHDAVDTRIDNILYSNRAVFAKSKFDIGIVKNYEAKIKLTENKFVAKKPYKCSFDNKKEIESQIRELLKVGLIEESYSPYAAPVLLVFKKDENKKSRLCIDYKELNKLIVPECQPFPRIEDLTVKAGNSKFFTKLDVNSAFWSIPVREKDRYKTAFVTHHGHWQWKSLPFGLKSSPAIFQRVLSSVLRKKGLDSFAVNYIDDILIFSDSYEDHLVHIDLTLEALLEEGFKLNLPKCRFAHTKVTYLGHIIGENCIQPIKDNLVAIRNFPIPKNLKQVRQFLGKIGFYLEYIPNHSILLDPLHNLERKNVEFVWSPVCNQSFEKAKNILCSSPILAIFNPNVPVFIYTDASLEGVGATLKQPQVDGSLKPVFYFSKKLTNSQKTKKAIFLECLAIKEAIKYWQYFVIGKKFTVYTDHKPLENLNVKKSTDEDLLQMLNFLSQFDFVIKYNPGKANVEADVLSRNPVLGPEEFQNEQPVIKISNLLTVEDIKNNQRLLGPSKAQLVDNEIRYKNLNNRKKIWLTEDFGIALIKKTHTEFGHIGIKQLTLMIGNKFYFKNMYKHMKLVCRSCVICAKNKSRIGCFRAPLSQLGPATKPLEIVSVDSIGGFKDGKSTKRYIHLLIDHFTRYAWIVSSRTQMARDFINLVNKVNKFGVMETLLADQYPGINSDDFKRYLKKSNITLIFTAVDCAFSNGLNERANQTIVNRIRCCFNQAKKVSWPLAAEQCIEAYNNTIHSTTGFTPKYLLLGSDDSVLPSDLSDNTISNLEENRKIALERSKKSHLANKQYYDKNVVKINYQPGDRVFIQNSSKLNRKKLDCVRLGPFVIIDKISDTIFKIDSGLKKKESNLFHASKLVPFINDPYPLRGGGCKFDRSRQT